METNNVVKVPLKKVLTPVINFGVAKNYVISKGAKDSSYQVFPAQNLNNSQITVTCNPPSNQIAVNRRAFIRMKVRLTITGTPGSGGLMVVPGLDAPRSFPLSNSLNTLQVTLNNDQYSNVLNQYNQAFMRYNQYKTTQGFNYTPTASYLDRFQEYNDFLNPFFGGSAKNALGGNENSDEEGQRGAFVGFDIVSDTAGTAVVDVLVTEPIMASPFNYTRASEEYGFIGLNNMSLTCSFGDLVSSFWSHNNVSPGHSTISSISPSVTEFAVLLNFQTLPMDLEIPTKTVYPYFEITPYNTPSVSLAPNNSTQIVLNSVQLKTIPKRMYIYVMENKNDKLGVAGTAKTDTFASLENVNITFNNKVGLLSTASKENLYKIACENGCDLSWSQFTKYTGSVLAIDFSKDLSLNEIDANGVLGTYQLAVSVNAKNTGSRTINYSLYCVVVNEGVAEIVNGSMSHSIGVFNSNDVLNAPVDTNAQYPIGVDVHGGSILDLVGNIAKKALPYLSQAAKFALRKAPMLADTIENLGYGAGLAQGGIEMGGLTMGGKMMSRKDLRKKM